MVSLKKNPTAAQAVGNGLAQTRQTTRRVVGASQAAARNVQEKRRTYTAQRAVRRSAKKKRSGSWSSGSSSRNYGILDFIGDVIDTLTDW